MKRLPILLAVLLLLATAACTIPFEGGPAPIPSPTSVSPILPGIVTPVDPTAPVSPTPLPTSTLPPPPSPTPVQPSATPTRAPSSTPLTSGNLVTSVPDQGTFKVRFPANTTGVTLASTLPANDTHTYLIRALESQHLIAELFSPRNDLTLALRSQAGALLTPEQADDGYYLWRLPSNQEYRLQVLGVSQPSDYRLVLNIPRIIRFLPGNFGTIHNGLIQEGDTLLYQLRAQPGQTMTLNLLNVSEEALALGVLGLQSGQTVLATAAGETQWRGELPPGNTHYLVQVLSLAEGQTRFSLEIDIR